MFGSIRAAASISRAVLSCRRVLTQCTSGIHSRRNVTLFWTMWTVEDVWLPTRVICAKADGLPGDGHCKNS
jgi:hypothetical protein